MPRSLLRPLRSVVGEPIAIRSANVINKSAKAEDVRFTVGIHTHHDEIVNASAYVDFLPDQIGLGSVALSETSGMPSMPLPSHFPFPDGAPFVSIFGLGLGIEDDIARDLWVEIELRLAVDSMPVVGGIMYGGFFGIPYYVTDDGLNSANFGVPRELQLYWPGQVNREFLDADLGVLHQKPAAPGTYQTLRIEPITTDTLVLRLAEFPRIIQSTTGTGGLKERWGVALPYLYVFSHAESVRYHPNVAGGLLSAVQDPPVFTFSHYSVVTSPQLAGGCCDFVAPTTYGDEYYHLSAASLFAEPRTFTVTEPGGATSELAEFFASNPMAEGDCLRIYFEQTEDFERTIAGLKIAPRNGPMPGGVPDPQPEVRLRVFELDPLDGVSPIRLGDPEDDKYARLLYDAKTSTSQYLTCKFVRPSSARYFLLTMKCVSSTGGIIRLQNIELIQSARAAITTRASHERVVRSMSYRIVGEQLAEDYARMGKSVFSFALELHAGGQRRETLFEAQSLLDLLQSGNARLLSNHRRMEVVKDVSQETSSTLAGSWERRHVDTSASGWRQSETGDGVRWEPGRLYPPPSGPFRVYGNQETRTRTEHIGHQGAEGYWKDIFDLYVQLEPHTGIAAEKILPQPPADNRLLTTSATWEPLVWGSVQLASIEGLFNVSVPPIYLLPDALNDLLTTGTALSRLLLEGGAADLSSADFNTFLNGLFLSTWFLNGLSVSVGVSKIVGANFSTQPIFPTFVRTSTTGSIGTISQQANRTGYSFTRFLDRSYQGAGIYTEYSGEEGGVAGEMKRTIVHEPRYDQREERRSKGVEVYWQDKPCDLVIGAVPLGIQLPATAARVYHQDDVSVVLRFPNGMPQDVRMDAWFDVDEEVVRDDY